MQTAMQAAAAGAAQLPGAAGAVGAGMGAAQAIGLPLPPLPVFTVRQAMVVCGFDNNGQNLIANETDAERVARMVFANRFDSCYGKTAEDVRSDVKAFAAMPQAQGRIHWTSNNRDMVFTFISWIQDKYRTPFDPERLRF